MLPKLTNKKMAFVLLMLILVSAPFVNAVVLESGIPNTDLTPGRDVSGITISKFISSVYIFVLGVVGIAVFASLVFWGVVWISSGIADKRSMALGKIKDAFTGLAIALGAYIILNTINPDLLTLREPEIKGLATTTKPLLSQFKWSTNNQTGGCGADYDVVDVKLCFQSIPEQNPCPTTNPMCCSFIGATDYQIRNGTCESGWQPARYNYCSSESNYFNGVGDNMLKCVDGPNANANLRCCSLKPQAINYFDIRQTGCDPFTGICSE